MKKINKKIVLIADRIDSFQNINLSSDFLEQIEDSYFNEIYNGLKAICKDVIHYQSPGDFLNNIAMHKNDIVFPIWSGRHSRNRRALIPSICEAYGLEYIGADTYANIICQDKLLSKQFALKHGIKTPNYLLYESPEDNLLLQSLKLPLIIKPNFEGGSIGISKDNLVYNYNQAKDKIHELYSIYQQAILVEEFIPGKEVSIILLGDSINISFSEVVELYCQKGNLDFEKTIYSYEIKKDNSDICFAHRLITDVFPNETLNRAHSMFKKLGKLEAIRIDGRFNGEDFYLIELSPDIHFGVGCTFSDAFKLCGITYTEMLYRILNNTINNYKVEGILKCQ